MNRERLLKEVNLIREGRKEGERGENPKLRGKTRRNPQEGGNVVNSRNPRWMELLSERTAT